MALSSPIDPFIWGAGGAQLTPEEIARQREIAAALLNEAGDTSPIGHWSQGAARVVNALGGVLKERRADRADAANQEIDSGLVERLLGGMGGQGAPTAAAAPATDYASDRVAQAHGAEPIRQGLIARGLPEHVADAFVMNFQDESGLNPGINEANPTVPGSRGGFGLYQLTGPRRRAYEAYAAERGVDPADTDAQLDFLMLEGQGPEKAAFDAILAAPDTGTAAAAIVNKFLRPAEEHRASREARYLKSSGGTQVASLDPTIGMVEGGSAAGMGGLPFPAEAVPVPADIARPVGGTAAGMIPPPDDMALKGDRLPAVAQALMGQQGAQPVPAAPMPTNAADRPVSLPAPQRAPVPAPAPMAAQGGGMGMGSLNPAIIEALSNPAASEQTRKIAGILLGQQLEQNDPMRALQMEKARLEIAAAKNPKRELINAGKGRLYDPNTGQWLTAPDMGTDAPTVQSFYDDKGQEYKAQWDAQRREWVPVGGSKLPSGMSLKTNADGTVEFVQGAGAGQKLTEGQSKDIGFYTRGIDADARLAELDTQLTDWSQQNADKLPLGLGNYMREPSFRQAKQAADSFLTALLRKDTGAAITNQEFDIYGPMFLPVPGDDPDTIQQKRRARQVALLALKSGLGTAEAIGEANRLILGLPESRVPQSSPSKQPTVIDGYTIEEVE